MKKDRLLWITTIFCIIPMVLSAILYNKLSEVIPIHFNYKGIADNYVPKKIGAFGMPMLMAAINLFIHLMINNDPKRKKSSSTLKYIGKWTVPIISIILVPVILFISLGYDMHIEIITPIIVGFIIIMCGNYLPKCKQNYTVGIKLPWTLNSEVNWNKTHHLAGYLWILGGICIVVGSCIKISQIPLTFIVLLVIMIVPFFYSYWLYKSGI